MTTISKSVGRGDIALHRGSDERVSVKWEQDKHDGKGYSEKDLRDWNGKFFLFCNNKQVYETECITDSHGYCIASIPAAAFQDDIWLTRPYGDWKMFGYGPDGETEILGEGNYKMV